MHNLRFWLLETLSHFARTRIASVLSLAGIAAILGFVGAGGWLVFDFRRALDAETAKLELVVLLDKRISPARRRQIFEAARIKPVKKLELTLAPQALKRYSANLKLPSEDLRAANPLGDELRVELHDPQDFWRVRAYLTGIPGVMGARNSHVGASLPARLEVWRSLRSAAIGVGAVSSALLVIIVWAALRRSIKARERELRLMRMLGAMPTFIRAPFWGQGAALGLVGAALALVFLGAGQTRMPTIGFGMALLGIGAWAGALGAGLALRGVERDG